MEDKDLSYGQAEARLWVKWVAANFVAALFAEVLSYLMPKLNETEPLTGLGSLILWLAWGLILALMQWLVLRRWIPRARGWLIATAVAAFLYLTLLGLATSVTAAFLEALAHTSSVDRTGVSDLWSGIANGVLLGASIGFTQWVVLRRIFARAAWWILACAAGWTAAALLGQASACLQLLAQPAPGAITGIALVWLVRQTLGEGWETAPPPVVVARGKVQTCPQCGEEVSALAVVCRHCKAWLVDRPPVAEAGERQPGKATAQAGRRGHHWGILLAMALGILAALALPVVALVARAMACGPFHSSVITFAVLALVFSAPAGALPAVLAWIMGRRRDGESAEGEDFSESRAVVGGVLGVIIAFAVSTTCACMTFFPECL